jgi:hypothetical protein
MQSGFDLNASQEYLGVQGSREIFVTGKSASQLQYSKRGRTSTKKVDQANHVGWLDSSDSQAFQRRKVQAAENRRFARHYSKVRDNHRRPGVLLSWSIGINQSADKQLRCVPKYVDCFPAEIGLHDEIEELGEWELVD